MESNCLPELVINGKSIFSRAFNVAHSNSNNHDNNNNNINVLYHYVILQIGFVMYLLYRMLGTSAIIGSMVCIIIMIPLQFVIGKKMSNNAELSAVRPLYVIF